MHVLTAAAVAQPSALASFFSTVLSLISVPVVAGALTAIFRYISPTNRLSNKLQRQVSIYSALPESPAKAEFAEYVEVTLQQLNRRLHPDAIRKRRTLLTGRLAVTISLVVIAAVTVGLVIFAFSTPIIAGLDNFTVAIGAAVTGVATWFTLRGSFRAEKRRARVPAPDSKIWLKKRKPTN